jgi:predicted DNA-binding transcriptional regulator AlpA
VTTDVTVETLIARVADAVVDRLATVLGETVQAEESWRLLNVKEVAAMLGRSPRWVHQAVKDRGLPVIRLDSSALAFDPEAVKAWAKARSIPRQTPDSACTPLAHPPLSRGNGP